MDCRGRLYKECSWITDASKKAGELSAIESAVIVVISDLLTVCVAKSDSTELLLPVSCCLFTLLICARSIVSCYPCYVFSCVFVNKPSFSIILGIGLFPPYTHRKIFVAISTFYHNFSPTPFNIGNAFSEICVHYPPGVSILHAGLPTVLHCYDTRTTPPPCGAKRSLISSPMP
ncbi:hypothetical protein AVEN_207420-1 [Araneus ventricosus]|uniref:Uncharacterized protein n=1 Tax=Araneus ventricosus TaxID=182803 RepID=A0A4Y2VD82_ARAVE|nr:hypothetical protein AVEN_207420-1 [Araneus ventricosus]